MTTAAELPIHRAPTQGVMERRDPLPPGRYWVYIDDSETGKWGEWQAAHKDAVSTIVTEPQQAIYRWLPAIFQTRWDLDIITHTEGYWILFDVTAPVPWIGLGYPTTVIDPAVKSSTDISTAPAPLPTGNPLAGTGLGDLMMGAYNLLLLGGALYIGAQAFGLVKALRSRA